MTAEREFVPALGFSALTPLYDAVVRIGMRERRMRDALIDDAEIEPWMRVLDLACGTGSTAIRIKQRIPLSEVIGVDIDEDVLAIARRKARRAGVDLRLERGSVTDSLAGFAPVHRVVSSLLLHHLDPIARVRTLRRAREVLAPGGRVHVADFGPPSSRRMRLAFLGVQALDGFATTRDSVRGTIPAHLAAAGFDEVRETRHLDTAFGTVRFYRGVRR